VGSTEEKEGSTEEKEGSAEESRGTPRKGRGWNSSGGLGWGADELSYIPQDGNYWIFCRNVCAAVIYLQGRLQALAEL
jgi:hypothetical protein